MEELEKEDFLFCCTYISPLSSSKRKGEAVRMKRDLSPLLEQGSLNFFCQESQFTELGSLSYGGDKI